VRKFFLRLTSLVSLLLFSTGGLAEECRFEKNIDLRLDLSASEVLSVIARAGYLSITGKSGTDDAVIKGTVCVSKEEWLEESGIETRDGDNAKISVELPDIDSVWSLTGNRYAYLDLELVVPDGLRLEVLDSSGSMDIAGVGEISVKDSSGSIEIEDVAGSVRLRDSSGSIRLIDIRGDVTIESDSSGSINGQDITGTVLVMEDSSGSIRFKDVTRDFIVERDSSGDIVAERIGGDFKVLKDGSGAIHSSDVAGEVSLPVD
jgi:hypothetical protein